MLVSLHIVWIVKRISRVTFIKSSIVPRASLGRNRTNYVLLTVVFFCESGSVLLLGVKSLINIDERGGKKKVTVCRIHLAPRITWLLAGQPGGGGGWREGASWP